MDKASAAFMHPSGADVIGDLPMRSIRVSPNFSASFWTISEVKYQLH